jgi:hypothetical protein
MNPAPFTIRLVCVLLSLTLAGCIFFETPRQRAMRNDPNFKNGYSDGCASANARGSNVRGDTVRDESAYAVSQPYRAGWSAGYSSCNTAMQQANPPIGGMPGSRP